MKDRGSLVVWSCPHNHPTVTGFLAPLEGTLRLCREHTGRDEDGYPATCDAVMVVCYDERPKVQGPLTEFASEADKRLRMRSALIAAQEQLRNGSIACADIVKTLGIALKGIRKEAK